MENQIVETDDGSTVEIPENADTCWSCGTWLAENENEKCNACKWSDGD